MTAMRACENAAISVSKRPRSICGIIQNQEQRKALKAPKLKWMPRPDRFTEEQRLLYERAGRRAIRIRVVLHFDQQSPCDRAHAPHAHRNVNRVTLRRTG